MRTIEAPVKLESMSCVHRGAPSQTVSLHHNEGNVCSDSSNGPIDCGQLAVPLTGPSLSKPPLPHHKLYRKGKSCSTDLDREEAWERKKEQHLLGKEEDNCADEGFFDQVYVNGGEDESPCGSDDDGEYHDDDKGSHKHIVEHGEGNLSFVCPDEGRVDQEEFCAMHDDSIRKSIKGIPSIKMKPFSRLPSKSLMIRTRTRSLTDEDMEELRGSVDLGFGFSYDERCNLKSTLPALELYYAINKNFVNAQCCSLPGSLITENALASASSPSSETWCISSPGDHPSQVKTRLRHWAQAVACSVKQGYDHD